MHDRRCIDFQNCRHMGISSETATAGEQRKVVRGESSSPRPLGVLLPLLFAIACVTCFPYPSRATMTASPVQSSPQRQQRQLLTANDCGALVEKYGILPGFSWGTAGKDDRRVYDTSGCDARICEYWRAKYGVIPHASWGRLPDPLKASWEWRRPSPAFGEGANKSCNGLSLGRAGWASDLKELVRRFAPVLRFYSGAQGYPITAQTYFEAGCHKKECSMASWLNKARDPNAHVYFGVNICGDSQIRIRYHFFYAWQPPCATSPIPELPYSVGDHQADWETVTVVLSEDRLRIAAVSYSQHGGWYTRVGGRHGFEGSWLGLGTVSDGRPVVYVGQTAHGSYHDSLTKQVMDLQSCAYFGDLRGGGLSWNTGSAPLVELTADSNETWIAATVASPHQAIWWNAGTGVSLSVSKFAPTCDMEACTGVGFDLSSFAGVGFKDAGCSQSQCKPGWRESGLAGCFRCPQDYMECLGTCARGSRWYQCINPFNWDRQGYMQEGYDYVLPSGDMGLLL
ncbi:hypothetical protein VOLCADRAFT_91274 [Volvox carteri f. nagariensis]|uniref:Uncharacterized protein n=1 Tax=Volvox carteri f. nagariensis TaxID=3068 RepID=D8TWM0_VOLCA|nr:uncharacterized protein VOLCADRAFT_91274 [Volvox carteri f. nagariensis]EFJ48073.1 hypothetical protein VOLCADRAFT_91274 [Volvox carteri f. nagariensis]|eukprot:XP_002950758.1 hypothetical protein VOLCADRAFT_91274 [Volvox carteri f. nagariensis]